MWMDGETRNDEASDRFPKVLESAQNGDKHRSLQM
jgi:hypothetical protein